MKYPTKGQFIHVVSAFGGTEYLGQAGESGSDGGDHWVDLQPGYVTIQADGSRDSYGINGLQVTLVEFDEAPGVNWTTQSFELLEFVEDTWGRLADRVDELETALGKLRRNERDARSQADGIRYQFTANEIAEWFGHSDPPSVAWGEL